jgi:hypothetical protein
MIPKALAAACCGLEAGDGLNEAVVLVAKFRRKGSSFSNVLLGMGRKVRNLDAVLDEGVPLREIICRLHRGFSFPP